MAKPVLHYLERYVGDPTVACDLHQETLIRIARGYAAFAGRSAVKTWAFAIANLVAADYFRDPERRTRIVELEEAAELSSPRAQPGAGDQRVCSPSAGSRRRHWLHCGLASAR